MLGITFLTWCLQCIIRPYCNYRGRLIVCVVVLPSFGFQVVSGVLLFTCRGDYTGWRIIYYSRSPLSEPDFSVFVLMFDFCNSCRGDSQGGDIIVTLVLPSLILLLCVILFFLFHSCRGDSQGVYIFVTLVLPPMKPESCILAFMHFDHFWVLSFARACWWGTYYHRGGWPPILYIYSLGHFLTTKGALIDGDGYPPKSDQNDPKKVTKMSENWSKFESKKWQKSRFLMGKSTFSLKFTQLTWKSLKNDQKLITNWGAKMMSNLTTKRGDSGSAGLLEEKCVMIEAPKMMSKIDHK